MKKSHLFKKIFVMSVGIKNPKQKNRNMRKLILLKRCKFMVVMVKTFQKMLGISNKISNFLNLCQLIRRIKKAGDNYWMNLEVKELFKILFYNFYSSQFQMCKLKKLKQIWKNIFPKMIRYKSDPVTKNT